MDEEYLGVTGGVTHDWSALCAVSHDLTALFASEERDFLIRNNGDQVKINSLNGKMVGIYFCDPAANGYFTTKLVEVYEELASKGEFFEVVYLCSHPDFEAFLFGFSKMPWLSIPYYDWKAWNRLEDLCAPMFHGIPHLVIIDSNGMVRTVDYDMLEFGTDAYPFTSERFNFLKDEEEASKKNQSLSSILVSKSRNYLVSNDGNQVPVSELEGKMVGLYFSYFPCCEEFTLILVEVYKKLKEKGECFEIVLISGDQEEKDFKKGFEKMPWLALPFKLDKTYDKLARYFEPETIPTLVIIGPDGKTLCPNVVEILQIYGVDAYPFTPEKLNEIAQSEKAKQESPTLESLLILGDKDFVIGKNSSKVPVSELVGTNILLYLSTGESCPLMPKLIKIYRDIKAKDDAFEVIFFKVPYVHQESSFEEYASNMP